MTLCPTCGWRHWTRRGSAVAPMLPLFEWAARRTAVIRAAGPAVRVILLDTCRDAEGRPRPALMIPGRRGPTVFPTIAAALAAKRSIEAAPHA